MLLIPLAVLLLVGVPANIGEVKVLTRPPFEGTKRDILGLAASDVIAGRAPSSGRSPNPSGTSPRQWLLDGGESGRIPLPAGGMTPMKQADAYSIVALSPPKRRKRPPCVPLRRKIERTLEPFDSIRFEHDIVVVTRQPGGVASSPRDLVGTGAAPSIVGIDHRCT